MESHNGEVLETKETKKTIIVTFIKLLQSDQEIANELNTFFKITVSNLVRNKNSYIL